MVAGGVGVEATRASTRSGNGGRNGESVGSRQGPGVVASSFCTREQQGTVRGGRVRQRRRKRARQRLGRYRKEEDHFVENPLAIFLKFATRSSSNLSDLKEASGHFHKFQENSYKLELTFRTSTKIGEVK